MTGAFLRNILLSLLLLIVMDGCTEQQKVKHALECIVSSVEYEKEGKVIRFKREDAIRNGFVYRLRIYDNGTLIVNDADIYIRDERNTRNYALQREKKIDTNMIFQFNETYDDVVFLLGKRDEIFHYTCTHDSVSK